jgi:hypothetical protein
MLIARSIGMGILRSGGFRCVLRPDDILAFQAVLIVANPIEAQSFVNGHVVRLRSSLGSALVALLAVHFAWGTRAIAPDLKIVASGN